MGKRKNVELKLKKITFVDNGTTLLQVKNTIFEILMWQLNKQENLNQDEESADG